MKAEMIVTKKNIFITGLPGTGKTTLLRKVAEELRALHPVGFFTSEIRDAHTRKGFELRSLDGRKGLLAHVDITSPHRLGKYRVDVKGFEAFLEGIPFLKPPGSLIIIDEIGKMECFSELFRRLVRQVLDSDNLVLATIALKGDTFIEGVKKRNDVRLLELNEARRDAMVEEIVREIEHLYDRRKS